MSSRSPIIGIIFDAFDTLVKPKSPPWKQYAEEARKVGFEFEDQDLKEAFKYAFKQTSSCHPLYGLRSSPPLRSPDDWWAKLIATTFSRPSLRIPNPDLEKSLPILTSRLIQRFGSKEAYELFPEVESSLEELKSISFETRSKSSTSKIETLRLSLATNSDSRMLDVLKDFNLDRFLNLDIPNSSSALPPAAISLPTISRAIEEHEAKHKKSDQDQRSLCSSAGEGGAATLSYFEGFEKPHPDFFKIASQRLFPELQNLDLQSVVYVGDQLKEDYLGAKQAGLRAFWLRRKGEDERSQPEIDVKGLDENVDLEELENDTVESLTDVVDRIRKINGSL